MDIKRCSMCGQIKYFKSFYWSKSKSIYLARCKECVRALARVAAHKARRRHKLMTPEKREIYLQQKRASTAVSKSLKNGMLVKGMCEVCGSTEVDAHHDDPYDTLNVRWLCRSHRLQYLRKKGCKACDGNTQRPVKVLGLRTN